jgi:hypothetical protein
LPFALSVQLARYGSSELIENISWLAFCISYDELILFKQSVVQKKSSAGFNLQNVHATFTQFVAHDIDHNVRTLDGNDSLHAMGLIVASDFPSEKL